jgi:hypothetical protein
MSDLQLNLDPNIYNQRLLNDPVGNYEPDFDLQSQAYVLNSRNNTLNAVMDAQEERKMPSQNQYESEISVDHQSQYSYAAGP